MKGWISENDIWIEAWKFTCNEGQRRHMIFIYSLIRLDHLTGYNKPSKQPAASWLVGSIGHFRVPPGPLFQNEGRCSSFDMETIFHSHANNTYFHKKGCTPSVIVKVRVFGTQKWPVGRVLHRYRRGSCRTRTSIPDLSSLLPLHYHTDPPKFRKKLSTNTSKLSFLPDTSITGDPSPFHNFWCKFN